MSHGAIFISFSCCFKTGPGLIVHHVVQVAQAGFEFLLCLIIAGDVEVYDSMLLFGRELWLANVPFFDSLSFTFLCYLGYALAIFLYAPLVWVPGDVQVADTRAIRTSGRVLVTGAFLTTLLDERADAHAPFSPPLVLYSGGQAR